MQNAMRKLFFWYVPLGAGLCAAALFVSGFYLAFFGRAGTPVTQNLPSAIHPVRSSELRAIVMGDSVGRGTGDVTALGISGNLDKILASDKRPHRATLNFAVNGARTGDLVKQLEGEGVRRVIAQSNVVVISIAGNDLHGDLDSRRNAPPAPEKFSASVLDRVKAIVEKVHEANPEARVFLLSVYNPFSATPMGRLLDPWVAHWTAQLIEAFRGDRRVVIVPTADLFLFHDRLSADRFHPSAEGYRLIARRIADAI